MWHSIWVRIVMFDCMSSRRQCVAIEEAFALTFFHWYPLYSPESQQEYDILVMLQAPSPQIPKPKPVNALVWQAPKPLNPESKPYVP